MRDIEIYPSSWYYNACVQGFLETLAWGLGEKGDRIIEEYILQNDGMAVIPGQLADAIFSDDSVPMPENYPDRPIPDELKDMKRLAWWWVGKSYQEGFIRKEDRGKELTPLEKVETVSSRLFYKNSQYENLVHPRWDKVEFLNNWFNKEEEFVKSRIRCSFCGQAFKPDSDSSVYNLYFTRSLSIQLGSGFSVFPNLFWDGKPNLPVCKRCRSYFLCFHITQRNGFFINSDSLLINWHLNRLIAGKTKGETSWQQKALLDAMRYDPQFRRGISSWGLQNMEILLFARGDIYYYPISTRLAKLLLVPQISSLIGKITNQVLWDCVIKERFDYLPIIIYKSLRTHLTGVNYGDDQEVISTSAREIQPIMDAIELYDEIRKNLLREKGGADMSLINTRELRDIAALAPLTLKDGLVFRLLELARLNRKADIYHLLLRIYVAKGMAFPETLTHLFMIRDDELFKTGIYAFISGIRPEVTNKNQ